jgi:hypothetical protein
VSAMPDFAYGWFDSAGLDAPPAYDPPRDAPCPYCGEPLRPNDVRTHSLMAADGPRDRSYFYRTHTTCDDAATEGQRQSLFGGMIERITAEQQKRP